MPCSCENCNSKFTNPKALENHEKLHSVDSSTLHKCDKCDYRFWFKSELKQHAIKHIKEAKYKYDKCGQKYKRKNKMKRLILLCESDKVIQCTVNSDCEFESVDIKLVNEHIQITHSKVKLFLCLTCNLRF